MLFNERLCEFLAGTPSRLAKFDARQVYQIRFADRGYNRSTTKVPLDTTPATQVIVNQLPIIPTQTTVPKYIGDRSSHLISGGTNSNLLPILSNFSIAVGEQCQNRPMVEYSPCGVPLDRHQIHHEPQQNWHNNCILEKSFWRTSPCPIATRLRSKRQTWVAQWIFPL